MGWPYRFLDLSHEQKEERRQLLDYYGSLAQASVLVPLIVIQAFFVASWLQQRKSSHGEFEPSSPYAKSQKAGKKAGGGNAIKLMFRKLQWWCGDSLSLFGYQLGTKGQVLAAVCWTGWLAVLCFLQTGEDYLHLTKRFGLVAASQLPLQYLLALKSPYSPLQLITGSSHETLNAFHQLLGQIVTGFFWLHTLFYLYFFVYKQVLAEKLMALYILCGLFSVLAFTAVGTTALKPVRAWSYRVFYITHVSLATALLPVLWFHVSHIRIYLYETAAIYALNLLLRSLTSRTYTGSVKILPETNLLELKIPLSTKSLRWEAGQHAYISVAGNPLLRTFRSNPFTVASLPHEDGNLRFVARILDGNTASLARASSAAKAEQKLTIEGPYGLATHSDRLLQYDNILFIAGGVGATFVVPLYRQLLADLSPSKGSYRRQKVSFVWTVRSQAETLWALPTDRKEREGFLERLSVHVTGSSNVNDSFALGGAGDEDDRALSTGETEEGIELEEQRTLLSAAEGGEGTTVAGEGGESVPTNVGRPNISKVIEQTFNVQSSGAEKVAIIVCGPRTLSQAVRKDVGRYVYSGREVWFWEEAFAF